MIRSKIKFYLVFAALGAGVAAISGVAISGVSVAVAVISAGIGLILGFGFAAAVRLAVAVLAVTILAVVLVSEESPQNDEYDNNYYYE